MADIIIYDPADSDVAGRVTQYVTSVNTPDYDGETNKLVNPDLSSLSAVPQKYWKESSGSVVEMTQAEKDVIEPLSDRKAERKLEVDIQTGALIAQGFDHVSKTFSLSANAQLNWTNVYLNRANWSYPLEVSTLANGSHDLADQAAVESFYADGVDEVKVILDGGRTLKTDIDAAADQAALDAIVDTRT